MHIAIFFDRLGPYHRARLEAAARRMHVSVLEVAGDSSAYAWDPVQTDQALQRTTLFPEQSREALSSSAIRRAADTALDERSPDVVAVPGWSHTGALAALQWCSRTQTPAVMMSETTADDFARVWWQEWVKKRVVALCSAGLVGGTPHRAYLQDLGLDEESIFLGYDAVDNDHFAHGAQQARQASSQVRERLDLPERYFLASNRFIPKKNLPRLIQAFGQYRDRAGSQAWNLVLLGDGPERARVEDAIDAEGVREAVHLPGFQQYDALSAYYGLAGAFVHASTREQWGLVVNEAMATGLPVLVSDRCGCAPDLVADGTNGYTFDPYDVPQLAGLLQRLAHGDADRARMGDASREIIAEWGPDRFAAGLEKAAQVAVEAPRPPSSLLDTLLLKTLMHR